ncbi:MAG: transcription initiation protein [Bacteroidetes bacterium 43-93]|nr:transcription initiation protein [Bacteroidota bacterium]OJW96922.1 MAG: transcription initiation protein [Bacteroidetes bacterium 43-93]
MKEFVLLFRQPSIDYNNMSPDDLQALSEKWTKWAGNIVEQGKLADRGHRLATEGKVLRGAGVVTDGPFVEIKERLGGFIVVRAADLDEATTIAHGCPALSNGGSVEIRPLYED